jgi:hypothetical protein
LGLAYDVAGDDSHRVHVVELEGDGGGGDTPAVLLDDEIALRGGDAGEPGEEWTLFRSVTVNAAGHWLVGGETSAASERDVVLAHDGQIVLREGDTVAGVRLAPQAALVAIDLDDRGRVVHLWSTGGFGRQYVLFSCTVELIRESQVVLRARQPLYDPTRETITAFQGTGHGSAVRLGGGDLLYVWVTLSKLDGTSRQAVVATRLPACPAPPAAAAPGEAAERLSSPSGR